MHAGEVSHSPRFPRFIPALREHLAAFVKPDLDALVFPGAQGGPLRRGNFNKLSARPHAARLVGANSLHVHDLRHTGNTFAASGGGGIKDLMARMGHDGERAAMIYPLRRPRRSCRRLACSTS